ncbi:hypothetical protein ACFHPP_31215, partial [Falsiroseomonas sp. E2-1-a20]
DRHASRPHREYRGCRLMHRANTYHRGMSVLRTSIVLASGPRIGPGKVALLKSIRDTGSISAAARGMGMD